MHKSLNHCRSDIYSSWNQCVMMFLLRIFLAVGLAYLCTGTTALAPSTQCRCYPGESCWPSQAEWAALNSSVGGRLVATVPLGSPCHDPTYNATVCKSLQENWLLPQEQSVLERYEFYHMLKVPVSCRLHLSWRRSTPIRAATLALRSLDLAHWVTMWITPSMSLSLQILRKGSRSQRKTTSDSSSGTQATSE